MTFFMCVHSKCPCGSGTNILRNNLLSVCGFNFQNNIFAFSLEEQVHNNKIATKKTNKLTKNTIELFKFLNPSSILARNFLGGSIE